MFSYLRNLSISVVGCLLAVSLVSVGQAESRGAITAAHDTRTISVENKTNATFPQNPAVQPASGTAVPALNGAGLYAVNCAVCHGMAKRGSSGLRVLSAINRNIGGMGSLKKLTAAEIAAIANY